MGSSKSRRRSQKKKAAAAALGARSALSALRSAVPAGTDNSPTPGPSDTPSSPSPFSSFSPAPSSTPPAEEEEPHEPAAPARASPRKRKKVGSAEEEEGVDDEPVPKRSALVKKGTEQPASMLAGTLRSQPCLGCVKSALRGRSNAECFAPEGDAAKRCNRCRSGHQCSPCPSYALGTALKFIEAKKQGAADKVLKALRERTDALIKFGPISQEPSLAPPSVALPAPLAGVWPGSAGSNPFAVPFSGFGSPALPAPLRAQATPEEREALRVEFFRIGERCLGEMWGLMSRYL